MIAQEIVDAKDRPGLWRLEHPSGLWAAAMVTEEYAGQFALADSVNRSESTNRDPKTRQWQSSRFALRHLWETGWQKGPMVGLGLDVQKQPSGKPYVLDSVGQALPLALAHTVGMGAAALVLQASILGIGVDVERLSDRFIKAWPRIASVPDWHQVCKAGLMNQEAEAATLIWVIKEACFKAALVQKSLFGQNQIIETINIISKEGNLRWVGQVLSGEKDHKEILEFEAGCLNGVFGSNLNGVFGSKGISPKEIDNQEGLPWFWAVAWTNG